MNPLHRVCSTPRLFSVLCLAVVLAVSACLPAVSMELPSLPRIHADEGGRVVAGYQTTRGGDGEFVLLTLDAAARQAFTLGRFSGKLAGLAVRGDGDYLAVTTDGALVSYGDNPESLALPDSRWNIQALALRQGGPVVLHQENDVLALAVPDGEQSWRTLPGILLNPAPVESASLVPMEDGLFVAWTNRADDLSEGAIRQAFYRDGEWVVGRPLPIGMAASFSLFPSKDGIRLIAIVPDPLGHAATRVKAFLNQGGEWVGASVPEEVSGVLRDAYEFAAASSGTSTPTWLVTGQQGAAVLWPDASSSILQASSAEMSQWSGWGSIITLGSFVLLVVIYCRRSRKLSQVYPGRPVDLFSRGAALLADWLIVSFAMGTYHIANGDIRILPDLILTGDVMDIFWINLAALAVFTAASEGLFGRTPGKHFARIRVRSIAGGPPSMFQSLMRNGLRVVDMFPASIAFPGIVGMIATFLGPRRQRVGDMLAGTQVRRHLPLTERSFLLASASPRREELLRALGQPVRTMTPGVDEDRVVEEASIKTPVETVLLLAQTKARSVLESVTEREIVVGADTVVVLDGEILGKPRDREDAVRMLERLSGRSHKVFTGFAIFDPASGQGLSDYDETEVEFRDLSGGEIERYVDTGEPMDKAGAYGVQNSGLVRQIRGSFSNVAGLPMEKMQRLLMVLDS